MILQGVKPTFQPLEVGYANRHKKGACGFDGDGEKAMPRDVGHFGHLRCISGDEVPVIEAERDRNSLLPPMGVIPTLTAYLTCPTIHTNVLEMRWKHTCNSDKCSTRAVVGGIRQ